MKNIKTNEHELYDVSLDPGREPQHRVPGYRGSIHPEDWRRRKRPETLYMGARKTQVLPTWPMGYIFATRIADKQHSSGSRSKSLL